MRTVLFALALLLASVVRAQAPMDIPRDASAAPSRAQTHILYLIGDAGEAGADHSQPVLDLVEQVSATDSAKARTLLFLGDNIYEYGMHEKGDWHRAHDERNIDAQIQLMSAFDGQSWIIPGNHDWHQGLDHGIEYLRREEAYVEEVVGRDVMEPDGGCPGPVELPLSDGAVLVVIDTQWWIHEYAKPQGEASACSAANEDEVIAALETVLARNMGRRVIVAGHHPCFTYGSHGGRFPLREHVFPLTAKWKWAYLPLPVVGSIYPLYRSLIGAKQDERRGRYHDFAIRVQAVFARYPGLVYAAGHEHALQYSVHSGVNHVVSGSGAKSTWVGHSRELSYADAQRGFARITLAPDGGMRLEFFTLRNGPRPVRVFVLHE